jgi:anti-sigma regulatory factor (Ser/Thr protein kinase)
VTDAGCNLPPETASVAAARRHVESVLTTWGMDAVAWTCVQLISELATNAVIHARSPFVVELTRSGDVIRVCVRDGSPVQPGIRRYADTSTTGRGLRLVESMSTSWGVEPAGRGKTIWFELDAGRRSTAQTWDDGADVDLDALLQEFGSGEEDVVSATASVSPGGWSRHRVRLVPAAA